jgi:hypothetical protein
VLARYGVRKYVANAKKAEARNSLGQIAKDVATSVEREKGNTAWSRPEACRRSCAYSSTASEHSVQHDVGPVYEKRLGAPPGRRRPGSIASADTVRDERRSHTHRGFLMLAAVVVGIRILGTDAGF